MSMPMSTQSWSDVTNGSYHRRKKHSVSHTNTSAQKVAAGPLTHIQKNAAAPNRITES